MVHTTPERGQARFASLGQEIVRLGGPRVFPKAIQLPNPVSILRTDQRPRSHDIQVGHPQLHAEDSAVLRSLPTDSPISHPGFARGSRRQIIFFIGLFQHLEDLTLYDGGFEPWASRPADDPTLIPPFTPPLRGRLEVIGWNMGGLMRDVIQLFGGIRFRYMNIGDVGEARLLLGACAGTLETLRLDPNDLYGKQLYPKHAPSPANDPTAKYFPLNFDLSRNKSLRTLEVRARSIVPEHACGSNLLPNPAISTFFRTILPTITSPVFSEVIIFYGGQ